MIPKKGQSRTVRIERFATDSWRQRMIEAEEVMNALTPNNTTHNAACRRTRGVTLVETLVVIAIISVLLGILVVSSKAVLRSQNRSDAKQEVMMIAAAIDKYATFWPAWEVTDINGRIVKIADRGWPDYLPARLFDTISSQPAFVIDPMDGFNAPGFGERFALDTNGEMTLGGVNSGLTETAGRDDQLSFGSVLNANICLAYALTSKTGKGPYLQIDDDNAMLREVASNVPAYASPVLPQPITTAANNLHLNSAPGTKLMLVDPWGTPYRYFWVTRNSNTPSGFAPIGDSNVNNIGGPDDVRRFHRAVGYVLESAGPDRKFGNRWWPSYLPADLNEADDNIIVQRP